MPKGGREDVKETLASSGLRVRLWSDRIDGLVNWLKWPAATMAALVTPLLAWSLLCLAVRVAQSPWNLLPFVAGAALFVFVWRGWLSRSRVGRFLLTMEHELTHAMFAVATFHRIVGFKASLGRGGEVRFTGRGNWLITAAPYFFPTAAIVLFLLAYLLPFPGLPWKSFCLGIALGYHVASTARETHRDQSDLKVLGKTFCWLFLPAANLAVVGLLVAFAHGGAEGVQSWVGDAISPVQLLAQTIK